MDPASGPSRFRGVSAHAIALVALFVALGSGAYAALGINSVGIQQLQKNSVDSGEIRKGAVGQSELKSNSVGFGEMIANSIGQEQLQPGSVGLGQMLANSIGREQLQIGSVIGAAIGDGTIEPQDLSPAATTTLYTDNNDPGQTINTDTQIGALSLPAGTYLVLAGVQAVHTGNAVSTRLECYVNNGATVIDFAKVRLQPNVDANNSLIFAKAMLQGPATLAGDGTLTFRCATVDTGSPIALDRIHFSALRVGSIVAQ